LLTLRTSLEPPSDFRKPWCTRSTNIFRKTYLDILVIAWWFFIKALYLLWHASKLKIGVFSAIFLATISTIKEFLGRPSRTLTGSVWVLSLLNWSRASR
jgi:hypothetical protein